MNKTLTMVLEVGTDFRNAGKHPTWIEISDEVAKRMHAAPCHPWEKVK